MIHIHIDQTIGMQTAAPQNKIENFITIELRNVFQSGFQLLIKGPQLNVIETHRFFNNFVMFSENHKDKFIGIQVHSSSAIIVHNFTTFWCAVSISVCFP